MSEVEIAYAPRSETEEIARFMAEVFPRAKWGMDRWRMLLDGRWAGTQNGIAITARDRGKLVGVLGMVTAERPTYLGPRTTANMSSWYLLKSHRGTGLGGRMLDFATSRPGITVTNFATSALAKPALDRSRLVEIDAARHLFAPRGPARLRVHSDPLALGSDLSDRDRQIVEDHAGLAIPSYVVETPDGLCLVLLSVKRKVPEFLSHELLYAGDLKLLGRYVRDFADALLPPEGARLAIDERFLPPGVDSDARQVLTAPRYSTPGDLPPSAVDHIYSEIVLLDLKIH